MIGLYFSLPNQVSNTIDGGDIGSIEIDATLEERHEWKAEATKNPVEVGAPVTDHVIEQPDRIALSGTISNSPLRGEFAGLAFTGESSSPRSQTTFDLLYALIKARQTVTFYTKHKIYNDMIIENINVPRNARVGEELQFTLDAVHVRFVNTQLVNVPPGISAKKTAKSSDAVAKKAEPQKNNGKTESQTKSASILSGILQ